MADVMPVLTSLIGVIGALSGAWVANRYNEKRFRTQIEIDKQKENKKLLISKAEELHLCVTSWDKAIFSYHLHQVSVVTGKIHESQLNEYLASLNTKETHDRLENLLSLYFRDLRPHMVSVRKQLKRNNAAFDRFSAGKLGSTEALSELEQASKEIGKLLDLLKLDLQGKVDQYLS